MMGRVARFVLPVLAALAFAVCGCDRGVSKFIENVEDLKGLRCGIILGSVFQDAIERMQPDLEFHSFNNTPSAVDALRIGKVDVVPIDGVIGRQLAARYPKDFRVAFLFGDNPYGYFYRKGSPLKAKIDPIILRMKETGEIGRLVAKWCDSPDIDKVAPEEYAELRKTFTGKNGVLRVSTYPGYEPGTFLRADGIVGFEMDILQRIALELDKKLEFVSVQMSAIITTVESGRADMGGGCVSITAERAEKVDFSVPFLNAEFAALVRSGMNAGPAANEVRSPKDLVGKEVGAVTGSTIRLRTEKYQPGLSYMSFNDYVSGIEALRRGKIAAMPMEKMMADIWAAKCPGEFRLSDVYIANDMGYFCRKGNPLLPKVNEILRRLHETGEVKRLYRKWCGTGHPELEKLEEWKKEDYTGKAGVLRFAVDGEHEPGAFSTPTGIIGLDIDLMNRIAVELDMRLQLVRVSLPALVVSVQAGKADFGGGNMSITEERLKLVDFTIPTIRGGYVLLLPSGSSAADSGDDESFLASLKRSFVRTFVTEGRWRMMTTGLGTTLTITILTAVFGTLLAFPVWKARTSRRAAVAVGAKTYIAILQGTPILVLLMVLFYLVFGSVDVDGLWVAVLGFALNGSAYIGEALRSGIDSIPRGQTEAALALGYTPRRAFLRFVLPQAVRAILPVYRGILINILKNTSVVGYIAINDLTKASDLIRSRTYESFFPILTTAFIYFVTAWLLARILDCIGRRLDPAFGRSRG